MANSDNPNGQRIAYWYRAATKAYTMLPYYLARGGHAFPPIHYYFEMTRRCNLRCAMCQYIEWLRKTPVSDQKEGELTTAEWERVIDEVQRLSLITFTGGEPLLREDFPNLLERAGQRARTHFITNGLLLDDDRVERVVSLAPKRVGGLGLNFIGTSLEAHRKSMMRYADCAGRLNGQRKRSGAWRKPAGGRTRRVRWSTSPR
ncbi:MAG TPA: radical SAM protein [Candidatus Hydrogenedentes bacterium]|nr:radical SAM protein [Candidatus Hydrogenedentota bacterium]